MTLLSSLFQIKKKTSKYSTMKVLKHVSFVSLLKCMLIVSVIALCFIVRLKYYEFLTVRKAQVEDAKAFYQLCSNEKVLQSANRPQFKEGCMQVIIESQMDPVEYAIKDTVCFILPYMAVMDRDASQSILDVVLGNERLMKLAVVFIIFYILANHFGLLSRQTPLIMPLYTPQIKPGLDYTTHNHCNKEKVN